MKKLTWNGRPLIFLPKAEVQLLFEGHPILDPKDAETSVEITIMGKGMQWVAKASNLFGFVMLDCHTSRRPEHRHMNWLVVTRMKNLSARSQARLGLR